MNVQNLGDNMQGSLWAMIAVSVFLHIVFIAFISLLANDRSSIKITTPIYTVDLLAPEEPTAASKVIESESQRVKESNIQRVKEEKAIALKKEKAPSLDEAIKKIRQRVKKREAEDAIGKAIQGLENRQVEKRIKEIRERVAHKQDVVKSVRAEERKPEMQKGAVTKRAEGLEEKYAQLAGDLIHDEWNYTEDINKGDIAVLYVRIDKAGHLVESHIEQSSGNIMLVESAVRAIEKAAKLFPPLPQEMGKDFVEIGVCFPRCRK